jgi:D-alanyl-lipoteichoic acid acyltransferase DltB (MBOAT superfamily)
MGSFPLLAATPAEFWRRWNQPAQQFFRAYAAAPLGGMRRPIRSTLGTFALSAAGHEYIFSVAAGRLQGYQFAFFMLHGLAVIATLRLRPQGWRRVPCIVAMLTFLVATTVLFGWSLNEIVPIYDAR